MPGTPNELVEAYRQIMLEMAPGVIVIPAANLTTGDCPAQVHRSLLEISREYARRVDWGWDAAPFPEVSRGQLSSAPNGNIWNWSMKPCVDNRRWVREFVG